MITIKKLAEITGVSPTTVSNVIHGRTREVSEETIAKIRQAVREHNYIPNMNARNLAGKSSRIIGVTMKYQKNLDSNFMQDPFTGEFIGAVEYEIRKRGYFMMLYLSGDVDDILKFTATWNVDGMLVGGFWPEDCRRIRGQSGKPMVFVDGTFEPDGQPYYNIGLKDEEAAREMTNYLIANGHRRIGFITDDLTGVYATRLAGYRRALAEAGIPYESGNLLRLSPDNRNFEASMKAVLDRISDFTAFFVVSDYYAAHLVNFFSDHGVRVPEDISIAGFDGNFLGDLVRPKLTTMRQQPEQKGILAVDLLFRLMGGEHPEETEQLLAAELLIRDSVSRPAPLHEG